MKEQQSIVEKILLFLMLGTLIFFTSHIAADNIHIIQKPILFDAKRIALTKQYRFNHYGITSSSIEIVPKMIVLHYTSIPTFEKTFQTFYPAELSQKRRVLFKVSTLNVSAQFLVDRDGTIYQLMPINWMARHIIGLNNIAIGIENVGGVKDVQDLTPAQVTSNVKLIRYLKKKYHTIQYLIGHYEYGSFRTCPLWQEKDPHYFTSKADPGPKFMHEVRAQVSDLKLLSKCNS